MSLLAGGGGSSSRFKTLEDPIFKPEKQADVERTRSLEEFMDEYLPTESAPLFEQRQEKVNEIKNHFHEWVRSCYLARDDITDMERLEVEDIATAIAEGRLGYMLVSGSHRLDIRDVEADVDACVVVPNFCSKEAYFGEFADKIAALEECSSLKKLPDVRTPNITFVYKNLDIDLLFVQFNKDIVPTDTQQYLKDEILLGLDPKSIRCLCGPRDTNQMLEMLRQRDEQYRGENSICRKNFTVCVRFVRKWAKSRGIYSNKHGYFGGVNLNILVSYICLRYPNQPASNILYMFFFMFSTQYFATQTTEPKPVKLNVIEKGFTQSMLDYYKRDRVEFEEREIKGLYPWTEEWLLEKRLQFANNPNTKTEAYSELTQNFISIITPTFPAQNSMTSATFDSRAIIKEEFTRAYQIIDKPSLDMWKKLVAPTDFFLKYDRYIRVAYYSSKYDEEGGENEGEKENDDHYKSFEGYMESYALKHVCNEIKSNSNRHYMFHMHPKCVKSTVYSSATYSSSGGGGDIGFTSSTYYIGIRPKTDKELRDDDLPHAWARPPVDSEEYKLNLDDLEYYKSGGLGSGLGGISKQYVKYYERSTRPYKWDDSFELKVESFKWKDLPEEVFKDIKSFYGDKADSKQKLHKLHKEERNKVLDFIREENKKIRGVEVGAGGGGAADSSGREKLLENKKRPIESFPLDGESKKLKIDAGADGGGEDGDFMVDESTALVVSPRQLAFSGLLSKVKGGVVVDSPATALHLSHALTVCFENGEEVPVKNLRRKALRAPQDYDYESGGSAIAVEGNSMVLNSRSNSIGNGVGNSRVGNFAPRGPALLCKPEVLWWIKKK